MFVFWSTDKALISVDVQCIKAGGQLDVRWFFNLITVITQIFVVLLVFLLFYFVLLWKDTSLLNIGPHLNA